ncbi:MAG: formate/nitrite transporter family protein [Armatimonadota bacterium]|nr:formate/nitrite transporter family protein [Armatimonadota bacterium]
MTDGDGSPTVVIDAYVPAEMASRAERVGVTKARLDTFSTLAMAVLAGAFISLGSAFYTTIITETGMGYGPTRMLGGLAFSLGLILVIVAGAELFTGNTLIVMAWTSRKVTTGQILRNWALVYLGNMVGSLATAALVYYSGQWKGAHSAVGATALSIAAAKLNLGFGEAFLKGMLCNAFVCLAVWLCYGARSVTDKILAIVFPITAFVAMGFEHSVANMYFLPLGIWLSRHQEVVAAAGDTVKTTSMFTTDRFLLYNLLPVTLGNIIGGSVMVGWFYWFIFLRPSRRPQKHGDGK